MRGGTSAMFTRALRTDARRLRPHLFRMLFAGMILGSLVVTHIRSLSLGAPGLFFFSNILWINLVLIVLAAASVLSTAITEEKEEGTLGLLMLAGVSPLAVLLGKSMTRQFSIVLLLVVQFPFALLAIVLGGVTLNQIVSGYIALAAFLALVANLGLLSSVFCRRSGTAGMLTLLGLVVVLGGGWVLRPLILLVVIVLVRLLGVEQPVLTVSENWWSVGPIWFEDFFGGLPGGLSWIAGVSDWLVVYDQMGIVTRLQTIGSSGFSQSPFSSGVALDVSVAVILFVIAWCVFKPATRDSLGGVAPRGLVRVRWWRWPRWLGAGRAWRMAIAWKEFHFTTGGVLGLLLKTLAYGGFVVVSYWMQPGSGGETSYRSCAEMVMSVLLLSMAVEGGVFASRVFHDERKYGTLPVTLGFPLPTWRIVLEKLAGGALGLLPVIAWFSIATRIDESVFQELATDYRTWIVGLVYLVLVHLVVLLSLYVRWGALPLALALMLIVAGCGFPLMWLPATALGAATGSQDVMVLPVIYACGAAVAVLLAMIVLRLKSVVAE